MLGYCGLDCEGCPVFIAKRDNDDELKLKTAREWSALYAEYIGKECLTKEDINCSGCCSEGDVFVGCAICPIRKCGGEKELNTCAQCDQYNSCEMLNGFYSVPEHQPAKTNLDRIRAEFES